MSGAHVERQNVQYDVPLGAIIPTGAGNTVARTAQGQFSLSLPTAATSYVLGVPITGVVPHVVSSSANIDRFGFKLEEVVLWYLIGAVDLTAHTFTLNQETMVGAAARAASTAFGGTLTYDTNTGASAALATTFGATAYVTRVILGTPTYLLNKYQRVTGEWTLATGAASGTATIYGVGLVGRWGIYY